VGGQDHRPGGTTGQDRAAIVRGQQGRADGGPLQRAAKVRRLPAGQVDEVGLADGLCRARIIGTVAIAHEQGLDLRAKRGEMRHAHRRPALEHLLAVGV
jgi:hypothetical protein